MRGKIGGIGLIYLFAATGLVLVAVSLLGNIISSFFHSDNADVLTIENYRLLFGDKDLLDVLWRTIMLGVGTVFWLFLFAFPITWLMTRTDYKWKAPLFTLMVAKLAIPGFITAMAYVWLFNPNSGLVNQMFGMTEFTTGALFNVYQLSWIAFLQGIVLVPGGVFMLLPAFRNLDSSLEEASWVSGVSKHQTIRKIVLPLLAPSMIAVAIFYFVVAVEIFDFVAIIGMKGDVLVLWIYDALSEVDGQPNLGYAGAVGVLLFALCGTAIVFYTKFLGQARKYAVIGGKTRAAPPQPLGKWRRLADVWVLIWFTCAIALPVISLIWVSLVPYFQPPSMKALASININSYLDAYDWIGEPLKNTLIVMVGAMLVAMTLAISLTWLVTRSKLPMARWGDMIIFLAPAVPTIVTAVAFQFAGIAIYHWLPLYGTIWLIAIAMGTRMLAYCTRTMNSASLQIQFELDEAAYVSGVSKLVTFRRVFLPIMLPAIFYSALMVGMLAARDLTLPLVMNTGKSPVVSVMIFDLQTNGEQNAAAALALYMIIVLVILALSARRITGMQEIGSPGHRIRRKLFSRSNGRAGAQPAATAAE